MNIADGPKFQKIQRSPGGLRSHWLALVISSILIGWVLYQSPNFGQHSDQVGSPIAGDFLQEWVGGYALRSHGPAALFDHTQLKSLQHDEALLGFRWTENEYFAMVYPPFYYLLWIPISFLPYAVAAWIFITVMIGCLFVAHALMLKSVEDTGNQNQLSPNGKPKLSFAALAPWLLVGATIYTPLIRSITTGQKGTFCLLILAGTYLLYLRSRKFSAGLTFGLMAFKPQLAIVVGLAMLARKQWSFVAASAMMVALFVGMCLAMGGDTCWQYTQFCLGAGDYVETSGYDLYKSHCLFGFFAMLGGGQSTAITKICWLISAGLISFLLMRMFRAQRKLPRNIRVPIEFSALILATLLLTPHLFSYDLTVLLLPMYLLTELLTRRVFSRKQSFRIAVLLIALFAASGFSHVISAMFGLQLTTLLMLGLFWTITWELPGTEAATEAVNDGMNCELATG